MPNKMVQKLKVFLRKCLEDNQLSGLKDVVYDADRKKIVSIPGLVVHIPTTETDTLFTLVAAEKTPTNDRSLTPRHLLERSKKSATKTIQRPSESSLEEIATTHGITENS